MRKLDFGGDEMRYKPICFKCEADITSFSYIDFPVSDKLLMIVFCKECGAVQGIVAKEK